MIRSRRDFIRNAGILALGIPLLGKIPEQQTRATAPPAIKPKALKEGDTIAITSPAGAIWDPLQIEKFASILQSLGFKVRLGNTLGEKHGYFAGTDSLRAKELMDLFTDKTIAGIFCMKGGWGCARLLDKLDYDTIGQNPKVLMGFSDITALLIAIYAKTGLVTFHGPVGNSGWNEFSVDYIRRVLMKKEKLVYAYPSVDDDKPYVISPGKVSGKLVGGNLTVLAGIIGSGYLPDWKSKILFLEEAKEEPYSIDRMLTQLKLAGVLQDIRGFIFGKCVKCLAEEPHKAFLFKEVLEQHIKPLGIPAYYGAMIGHIENKFTVPIGTDAQMDAGKFELILQEPAVS